MNFRQNLGIAATAAIVSATAIVIFAQDADAAGSQDRTPPCLYEDGSGQGGRCVWDARHMGNGEGRSLVIFHGGTDQVTYHYVSHKWAHHLMTTSR